jgi:hypothetical protein
MNTEGKKPFLEFFCKKENSMYSFPITELNVEQIKTFLPLVPPLEPVQEMITTEEPIQPVAEVPATEEEPIQPVAEEEPIQPMAEEEPIQPMAEEEPIQPVAEEEPIQPVAEEAPLQPVAAEEPIQPTEEEAALQPVAAEEPIQPAEEEPIQPVAAEEPFQPVAAEEPIQPSAEEQLVQEAPLAEEEKQQQKIVPLQQGGEEYDEITNLFFEQCSQYFQKITGLSGETASEKYKGYISLSDNKHIAVFDVTDLEMEPQEELIWATLYEIIDKKHILDIPIAEFTHKTFSENPVMNYITNQNGAAIDIPIVVYMCQENGGSYDNSYYSEEESREQTESIINYRVSHPVLGYCFLFTTEPFEHNNLSKIKRFSLFTIDTIYLINKDRDLSEYQDLDLHEYEILCFYENSVEYWAVDSSDQFLEL